MKLGREHWLELRVVTNYDVNIFTGGARIALANSISPTNSLTFLQAEECMTATQNFTNSAGNLVNFCKKSLKSRRNARKQRFTPAMTTSMLHVFAKTQ